MALKLGNRVRETTATTGTGTFSLAGAVASFQTFVAGVGNGNTTYYAVIHRSEAEFEVGIGTVTDASTDTLARTTVLFSSNSNNAVSFSAGTKDVFVTVPAEKQPILDASDNLVIGTGAAGVDYALTFDGESNDGVITWKEDEDYFEISDDILLSTTEKLYFRDTAISLSSTTDGQADLVADTTIQVTAPTVNIEASTAITLESDAITLGENGNTDVVLNFNATSNDGVLTWKEDEDYFELSDDLLIASTEKLYFNDTSQFIQGSSATVLAIGATDEIDLTATAIDINGAVDISNGLTSTGAGNVLGATSFSDASITNVTDIQLDSISGDADSNTSIAFSGSDVITVTAGGDTQITINNGSIVPTTDNDIDLGTSSLEFKDAFFDGTVTTDALVADTADINGGTIDGTVIGGNSAAAITGTAITGTSFVIGSADINEAELETIDGVSAGTVAASKAVVVDSNKDIGSFRNITLTGELDAGSLDVSGDVDIDGTLEADAITVDGTTLAEFISDTTGAMVGSNTETGVTVTYQDADNTIDFAINAAQTTITSLLATDIKIGEDDQTKIDFETADEIHFYAANVEQVYLGDNIFGPQSDSDVDLGTTGVRWKDAFIDTVTTTGNVTVGGNLTINGTTTTVATTNMVVADNLIELNNGASSNSNDSGIVIERGSTGDNAIFMWDESADTFVLGTTTATGSSTGNLSVTDGALQAGSLDISGNVDVDGTLETDALSIASTAVTSTAAELNLLDGITAGTISASLAVIVDSNKDITGFRNVTLTGELDAATLDISGNADIDGTLETDALSIAGTTVTATAAELNFTDGVTSNIQTQLNGATTAGFAVAMAIAL